VVTGNGYRTTTYLGSAFEHHGERGLDGTLQAENCSLHVMDDQSRIAIKRVGAAFADDGAKDHSVQYHLGDHLGSSGIVVSGNGEWMNREEFFPYGETSFGSFGRKRYRFTGKERDEESGLSYHKSRYYAPCLMRWLSCDPASWNDCMNLFVYTHNNPIRFVDRNGRSAAEVLSEISEVGKNLGRHLTLVSNAPAPAPVNVPGPVAVAAGPAIVIAVGVAAIALTCYLISTLENALNQRDAAEAAANKQKYNIDSLMEKARGEGKISKEQYKDYLKNGNPYFIGSDSNAQPMASSNRNDSSERKAFRAYVVETILKGCDGQPHPLSKLLNREGKTHDARDMYNDKNPIFDAGHTKSGHAGGEGMGVEYSPDNRLDGSKSEAKGVIMEKPFLDVCGIPIEANMLKSMENQGLVPKGTVARATPSGGWSPTEGLLPLPSVNSVLISNTKP
jgi:RHS repeat-associated protein